MISFEIFLGFLFWTLGTSFGSFRKFAEIVLLVIFVLKFLKNHKRFNMKTKKYLEKRNYFFHCIRKLLLPQFHWIPIIKSKIIDAEIMKYTLLLNANMNVTTKTIRRPMRKITHAHFSERVRHERGLKACFAY